MLADSCVVVGSIAYGSLTPKDVDLVVKEVTEGRNPTARAVVKAFGEWVESSTIGHLWINAHPLPVELFIGNCWSTDDIDKDANKTNYSSARRGAIKMEIFGVTMLVQNTRRE